MAFKKLTKDPKRVVLNQDVLLEHLTMLRLDGDRPLSEDKVYRYKEFISGRSSESCVWLDDLVTWIHVYVKEIKKWVSLNGNHTGNACLQLFEEGDLPKGYTISLVEYECDTLIDASNIFNGVDSDGGRTRNQRVRTRGKAIASLRDIPGHVLTKLVQGITVHTRLHQGTCNASHPEYLVDAHEAFFVWMANNIYTQKPNQKLLLGCVIAAIYEQYLRSKKASVREFWHPIMNNEEISGVRRTLYSHILGSDLTNRAGSRECYCRCISGYNSFIRGNVASKSKHAIKYSPEAPLEEVC